jgi:NAD/NADP transhydrogenase beta subunit
MNKKFIGMSIAIIGSLIFFSNAEYAWIVSAILLGAGSGIFFWKE